MQCSFSKKLAKVLAADKVHNVQLLAWFAYAEDAGESQAIKACMIDDLVGREKIHAVTGVVCSQVLDVVERPRDIIGA